MEYAENAKVPSAFEIPFGGIGGRLNDKIDRLGNTSDLFRKA